MSKNIIKAFILIFLITHLYGCTYKYHIPNKVLEENPEKYTISEVQTVSLETFEFKPSKKVISETDTTMHKIINKHEIVQKGGLIKNDTIIGYLNDGTEKRIPLSQVKEAYIKKIHIFKTVTVTVLAIYILGALVTYFIIAPMYTW